VVIARPLNKEQPAISALRYSLATPAIRDIQSSYWSRWYTRHKRPRWNVVRNDGSGRDDRMVANGNARKDRRRTTDPDVGTKPNWRNPGWTRRLYGMVVRVENSHQIPDQAIVTDNDTVSGHDSRTTVDEDTLAEHKGAILGSPHLDWHRLAAQEQTSACNRSGGDKHWVPPLHNHNCRSRTRPAEHGRRPKAGRHVTKLTH
jgi:hypothetical protein